MRTISATEAKQTLGRMIDISQREPVIIQRQQRDIAVLLSIHEYAQLKGSQSEAFKVFCDKISQKAIERGLTEKKLMTLLEDDSEK